MSILIVCWCMFGWWLWFEVFKYLNNTGQIHYQYWRYKYIRCYIKEIVAAVFMLFVYLLLGPVPYLLWRFDREFSNRRNSTSKA